MMPAVRRLAVLTIAFGVVAACGATNGVDTVVSTDPVATESTTGVGDQPAAQTLEQPAVWPAADGTFTTPEAAASDFVSQVFGVEPTLSEFRAGDSRSGEIDVLFPGESAGAEGQVNSVLFLRQLGAASAWFVIGSHSDGVSITAPEAGATVAPGPVEVAGDARGFEGTVVASAFPAGNAGAVLDEQITVGGPFGETQPYSVALDVSAGTPGDVLAVLVRGDTGADNDTGEFSVIPIVLGSKLPESK